MADDGGEAFVTSLRYSSRHHNKQMLLEGLKIVNQGNEVDEPSHITCQFCDRNFPNSSALQSHELLCSNRHLDALRSQGSVSSRRSKSTPRKINVAARTNDSCPEDEMEDALISEVPRNISPYIITEDQQIKDVDDINNNELALAANQEQLDPNAAAVIDGPCSCDLCHKTFSGIFALKAHNYYHHSSARRLYSCKLCPRQFKWEAILKRHINIVHGRRERRQNAFLPESFGAQEQPVVVGETRAQLRANVEMTSEDGYKCTTCSKVFATLSAVRLHRFSAHGTGPRRVCKFCNNSYRPCHFARHCCWNNKTGKRQMSLQSEPSPGSSSDILGKVTSLRCLACNSSFSTMRSLNDHLNRIHNVCPTDPTSETLSKSLPNGGDSEKLANEENGTDSAPDVESDENPTSTSSRSGGVRKAECPVCHKLFKNRGSLGMHRWRHHSLQKRFCTGCRKSYLASQFSSHICSNSSDADNEQPVALSNNIASTALFGTSQCANLSMASSPNATAAQPKCDMCNRQYANHHSLKDHMRVVHGVYQRITKSSTKRQNDATEQHSDSPVDSGTTRPSSSFSSSGAIAQGNNNCSSPPPLESDQWPPPPFSLRHRQATPQPAGSSSPPTSSPTDVGIINLTNAKTYDDVLPAVPVPVAATVPVSGGECECVTCHRFFKNSSALRLHRFSAHGACPRRLCSKCNKSFLPWHYLRHACTGNGGAGQGGEPVNDVDNAAGSSSSPGGMAETANVLSSYPPPTEWRCNMCERRYLSRRTLKDHMRVVHGVYQRRNVELLSVVHQPPAVNESLQASSTSGVLDLSCPPDAKRLRLAPNEPTNNKPQQPDKDVHKFIVNLSTVGATGFNSKSYKCGICHKLFRDIAALRKHRYSAHGTCPKRMCPRCKKFLLPWHVKRHCCWSSTNNVTGVNKNERSPSAMSDENGQGGDELQTASDNHQPKCDLCQRRYANDHTLKCHLRVIHGVYQRQKSTDVGFGSSTTANEDVNDQPSPSTSLSSRLEPSPEKPKGKTGGMPLNLNGNECGVCHKVFQSHGAARLHLFSAHGACPKRHCPTCNKWYLPWHYSRHFCQNVAAQAAIAAASSAAASGGNAEDVDSPDLRQSPWKCDSCDRQYLSHRTLKDHLRIAHGIYQTRRPSSAAGAAANDSIRPMSQGPPVSRETPSPPPNAHSGKVASVAKLESPSISTTKSQAVSQTVPPTPSTESAANKNPGITVIGDPSSPMYECDICSKVFKSSSAARLHRLSGHGACPKRVCPRCKRSFLPCHFARHSCTGVVGGELTQKNNEVAAVTSTTAVPTATVPSSSGLEWKCHLCDRRYQSSRTLKDHLRIGHGVYQTRNRGTGPAGTDTVAASADAEPVPLFTVETTDLSKNTSRPRGSSLSPAAASTDDPVDAEGNGNTSELQQLLSSNVSPSLSPNNENECSICHKSFKNSSALRLHRYVTHVSRRRQLCTRCNKSFLPCHFPRHCCWSADGLRQSEPNKNSKLNNVGSLSDSEKTEQKFTEDLAKHSLVKCEFCSSRFASDEALKIHLHRDHGIFPPDESMTEDEMPPAAKICKVEVQSDQEPCVEMSVSPANHVANDGLHSYIDDDGNEDDEDIIDYQSSGANGGGSLNTPTNGYKCGICHMPFSNLTDVRKHRYSTHGACPKRICPKCNKAILPCHFSRHSCDALGGGAAIGPASTGGLESQPQEGLLDECVAAFEWKCDLCDRRYLSRRTLNDHRRVVHGLYQRRPMPDDPADPSQPPQQNAFSEDDGYDAVAVPLLAAPEIASLSATPAVDQSDYTVKIESEGPTSPAIQQPPPAHSGAVPQQMSQSERDLRSLIVFPEPEGFGNDYLVFKQPKSIDDASEEISFEDPLAMMDAVVEDGADADEVPSTDHDGSPQDSNNQVGGSDQCTICLKSFKSSSALRLHRFSAHGTCPKRECPKCNKSFLPWHFTRHCCWNKDDEQTGSASTTAGSAQPESTVTSTDSLSATCELCRRSYTSARTLKEHMRTVHGVYQRRNQSASMVQQQQQTAIITPASQPTIERPPSSSAVPVAVLSGCGDDDLLSNLKQESSSTANSQQRYVCPDCNAAFTAPFDLLLHRLAHTGDKPFVCPDCKEAFAMPQELDIHLITVHLKEH